MKIVAGVILGVVVAAVIGVVLVLSYLGLMPGISTLLGSDRPRDLGVTYAAADYNSARAKTGTVISDLPPGGAPKDSLKWSGSKAVGARFTNEEMTALMNNRPWKYYPLSECQFKVGEDGMIAEFSGRLLTDRLAGYAGAMGASGGAMRTLTEILKAAPANPTVYLKGAVVVTNNRITTVDIRDFQIGRLSLPQQQIQDNLKNLASLAEMQFDAIPGFSVRSFTLTPGGVKFDGTFPAQLQREK